MAATAAHLVDHVIPRVPVRQWVLSFDVSYVLEQDFYTARYSGAGTVTAAVYPIDVELGLDNMNTSGCQESDFEGFGAGGRAASRPVVSGF